MLMNSGDSHKIIITISPLLLINTFQNLIKPELTLHKLYVTRGVGNFNFKSSNLSLNFSLRSTYQMQANQWAMRAKVAINSNNTAAPYSEYLSIFLATLTNLNNLAVFSKPVNVAVCNRKK